jgi:integrase-like protein
MPSANQPPLRLRSDVKRRRPGRQSHARAVSRTCGGGRTPTLGCIQREWTHAGHSPIVAANASRSSQRRQVASPIFRNLTLCELLHIGHYAVHHIRLQSACKAHRRKGRARLPIHVHMLRHSCGYALANKGHDTRAIQDWLGHRAIQHTVRYTELTPARFKDFWR